MTFKRIFKGLQSKFFVVMGLLVFFICTDYSNAFAWGHRHFRHHSGHYYFHHNHFYRPVWYWFDRIVVAPPIGAFVAILPDGYTTFSIGGIPYFHFRGIYFRPCTNGYVVVSAPRQAAVSPSPSIDRSQLDTTKEDTKNTSTNTVSAASLDNSMLSKETEGSSADTVVINIPNKDGSYSQVTLVKHGEGYLGPQKEYYEGHPTVEQLQVLYGK